MIEKASKAGMYGGAAVSTVTGTVVLAEPSPQVAMAQEPFFGLTLNEWSVLAIIVGILTTLAGFAVNWYYQHRRFEIEQDRRG